MLRGIQQFDLTGRVALVTGGSKGLGYAIADGLASAGASVIICSRNAMEAEAAAKEVAGPSQDSLQRYLPGAVLDADERANRGKR